MVDQQQPIGIGCAPAVSALGAFLLFAVAAAWLGLAGDRLWLVFAGLPVSGVITVIFGSDLFLAWPLDAAAWITGAVLLARKAERPGQIVRPAVLVVLAAVVLGVVLGTLVVPA